MRKTYLSARAGVCFSSAAPCHQYKTQYDEVRSSLRMIPSTSDSLTQASYWMGAD